MAGLVEKDIRLMWCNKQALILFLIIGVVIGLQNEAVILGWLPFVISIFLINTVTYDELDKGYGFLMTLPIDAETYVREKYFFCLTGGTVSWLVAAGLYMIMEMKQQMPVDMASQIPMVLVFLPVTALLIALLIPLQLVSGVEKSRVEIKDVCKVYNPGENEVRALDHVSLTIDEQEFVAIIGHSGSGKSTLMNMLGCLDVPTSGEYWLHGQDVSALSDDALSDIRNREIGFIFQGFNLIPNLTALENVELPLIYRGVSKSVREELSVEALKKVGLEHRMDHKPSEMSGGQQQRVAIARAIAQAPPVILADEPTGNLDSNSTKEIMDILKGLHKEGRTVILITHDNEIAAQAKRVIKIKDGKVESDSGQIVPVEELRTAGA